MSRFFVGNGTNWSSTSSWSASSGGASGASVPTASDDVFLDSHSPGNLTIDVAASCRSIDLTGFTHTLTHNAFTLSIGTSTSQASKVALKFPTSGWTYTLSDVINSAISFVGTSGDTTTADFGGKTTGNVTINMGTTSTIQLVTNGFNCGTTATVTLTQGGFDVNNQTCNWGALSSSNSNVRTLNLGSAQLTLTLSSGATNTWLMTTITNLTFNAGTSTITFTGATANTNMGAVTFNNVVFSGTSGQVITPNGTVTFANLTRTGAANKASQFTLRGTSNLIVTGLLTLTGNSLTNRLVVVSDSVGTARTLNAAAVSLSNVDFRDVTGAGAAASFTGTSLGDLGGNSNITFTAPVTRYWVATAGGSWSATSSWSTLSGGSSGASVPLVQDTVVFDSNSITAAAKTITIDMISLPAIDFTNILNSPIVSLAQGVSIYGSLKFIAGMTTSGAQVLTFLNRTNATITTGGITINFSGITIQTTSSVSLGDNFIAADGVCNFIVTQGTFTTNNNNITSNIFQSIGTSTRTINLGTSTITVTGTSAASQVNMTNTGITFNGSQSTFVFGRTSTSTRTFAGAGLIYGTLTYTVAGSTGELDITGANTFTTINFSDITNARTLKLPATTTQTINNFNVNGTSGKLMSVVSSTGGSQATISKTSGNVICDYLSLTDSKATGGATFYAGSHSTNVSDNTGWIFNDLGLQTITGVSRIQESVNQTITAIARITAATARTITGKSRIQERVNQTITGISRIQESVSKTITAVSRITASVSQTIQGVARITASAAKTISGVARIQEVVNKTITGLSRIQENVNQTITGIARITAQTTQNIPGVARIQESVSQTIQAAARITETATKNIPALARIQEVVNQTISATARITASANKIITSVARIQESVTKTITAKARIQETVNKIITGISRIQQIVKKDITGKATITNQSIRTITGLADIRGTTTQSITGKAFIIKPKYNINDYPAPFSPDETQSIQLNQPYSFDNDYNQTQTIDDVLANGN